jgi:hypothetical protein
MNQFLLSTAEFDVVWESLGLGHRHIVLDLPSPGVTDADRAHLVGQVWQDLGARGLARGNRPDQDLIDLLSVLAAPRRSVDVRIWADREIRALAAGCGADGFGTLAIIDSGRVAVTEARTTALPAFAVSVAGTLHPGPGSSVNLPHERLLWADQLSRGDVDRMAGLLEGAPVPTEDAEILATMCREMTVRGQFGAEHTAPSGRPVRAQRVVGFHDTPRGRYLHLARPGTDGGAWSTISPSDNRRLEFCVAELLDEITPE